MPGCPRSRGGCSVWALSPARRERRPRLEPWHYRRCCGRLAGCRACRIARTLDDDPSVARRRRRAHVARVTVGPWSIRLENRLHWCSRLTRQLIAFPRHVPSVLRSMLVSPCTDTARVPGRSRRYARREPGRVSGARELTTGTRVGACNCCDRASLIRVEASLPLRSQLRRAVRLSLGLSPGISGICQCK
jgi:hypothetical protein